MENKEILLKSNVIAVSIYLSCRGFLSEIVFDYSVLYQTLNSHSIVYDVFIT